ncbi:MAG: DUF2652 domain-containing protein, partial [Ginsengibacter sp.]
DNGGLLFIPDISGFTKFVNETAIEHSRYIIGELLENIINSNQMGLTVSEVEGDAVLFYRFGKTPSLEEIYGQVESMFCNFQRQLKNYETRRACQCSACIAAINLSLKVITHYGEFSTYNVQKYSKLIGKDVIVAHQLLKNDIDLHEYWLVTSDLFNSKMNTGLPIGMTWQQGNKQTEKGEVTFHYSMLSQLKEKVQPDLLSDLELRDDKIKMISKSKIIDAPSVTVLSVIGNFSLRPKWMEGITSVDQASHPINHVGVKHRSVFNNRSMVFYSSSFSQNNDAFSYSETDEKKTMTIHFSLESLGNNKTLLVIDYYVKNDPFIKLFFPLFMKNKLSRQLGKSLDNLEVLSQRPTIKKAMININ